MSTHLVYKPLGWTPLEALKSFCEKHGKMDARMSYAGRLDPMADGLLLLLEGGECDRQNELQNHDKTYEWEMVLGFETDSFDVLGLVKDVMLSEESLESIIPKCVETVESFAGLHEQSYPPFSAVRVKGHPLHWWASQGRLGEVTIPKSTVTIHQTVVTGVRYIRASLLLDEAVRRVRLVAGNTFRQDAIEAKWRTVMQQVPESFRFPVLSVKSHVSSGTYVRSLAHEVGQMCGCGAFAWRICRTEVAQMSLLNAWNPVGLDKKVFVEAMKIVASRWK